MATRDPIQPRLPVPVLLMSPPAACGQDNQSHGSSADRKAGSTASSSMPSIFAAASTQDGDTAKVPVLQLSRRTSMGEAGPHLLPLSSPDTPSSPHILSSNLGSLSEGQAAGASLQNFRHCQELLWHASEDNKVLQGRLQSSIDRNTSFANQLESMRHAYDCVKSEAESCRARLQIAYTTAVHVSHAEPAANRQQAEQAQQDVAGLRMQLEAAEAAVNTERQAAATMWAQIQSHQSASERNKQGQQELERAKVALQRCQRRLDKAEKALLESRRSTVQLQEKVSNLEDHVQYHQDLKAGKPAAVRRLQHAARQASVRADSAEDMSHELHWQLQNLKEGMTTVIEKLMAENVELTQRFNEASHDAAQLKPQVSASGPSPPSFPGGTDAAGSADAAGHDEVSISDSIPDIISRDELSDASPTPRIRMAPAQPFAWGPPAEPGALSQLSRCPSASAMGSLATCTSASQSLAQMILEVRPMDDSEETPSHSLTSQILLGSEGLPACCSLGETSDSTQSGLGPKPHSSFGSQRPEAHSPRSAPDVECSVPDQGVSAVLEGPKPRKRFGLWGLFSGGSRAADPTVLGPPVRDVEQGLSPP